MGSTALATAPMSSPDYEDKTSIHDFETLLLTLHAVREMRGELQIPPQDKVTLYIDHPLQVILNNTHVLEALTKIDTIHFCKADSKSIVATKLVKDMSVSVLLPEHLIAKEIERLEKDLSKMAKDLDGLNMKLLNHEFIAKAPQEIVAKMQENLKALNLSQDVLRNKLAQFKDQLESSS
jgi:valyl-tRNA synthetase